MGVTYQAYQFELEDRAADMIVNRATPRLRARNVKVNLRSTDELAVLALDMFHRVIVARRPDQGGAIIAEYLIEGDEHEMTPTDHVVTFHLSLAPPPYWILGTSLLGLTTTLGA
jgi:hypothetical protein